MALIPRHEYSIPQPEKQNFQTIETLPPISSESETGEDSEPNQAGEKFATKEEVTLAIEHLYKKDKNIQDKFIRYAQKKITQITGKKENVKIEAEFIVEEAIYRILKGNRKWYQNRVESIFYLILMVVISLIKIEYVKKLSDVNPLYNEKETGSVKRKKNKANKHLKYISYSDKKEEAAKDPAEVAMAKSYFNENRNFEDSDLEYLINEMELLLEDDEEAYFVFQARLEGVKSNIEIAKTLGLNVSAVENALKRIKRHLKKK